MTYDPDAARQELQEAQFRIAELSTALEAMREDRDNYKNLAHLYGKEIVATDDKLSEAYATIERLRLHIQQGVEL